MMQSSLKSAVLENGTIFNLFVMGCDDCHIVSLCFAIFILGGKFSYLLRNRGYFSPMHSVDISSAFFKLSLFLFSATGSNAALLNAKKCKLTLIVRSYKIFFYRSLMLNYFSVLYFQIKNNFTTPIQSIRKGRNRKCFQPHINSSRRTSKYSTSTKIVRECHSLFNH